VLVGLGSIGASALAGCSSDSPEDSSPNGGGNSEPTTEETTTAERTTTEETTTSEPAEFEIVGYEVPETAEIGENVTLSITVRNTGGQEGSLSVPIYARTPDSSWQEGAEWTFANVGPGETATRETDSIVFEYITRYEFRLGQSSSTAVVQSVSAKLSWGEEYTTPAGYRIRIDEPTLQDTYEYEDYMGNIEDSEPENGGQWAFVNVWVKNETGQTNFSPLGSDFGMLYGNSQSDGETILIDDPINKGEPFDGGELQPGVERNGWIAYQIPGDVDISNLTVAWSQETFDGQIGVNWTTTN